MLHVPADPPALWGSGSRVAWSKGEGLMIYAPQGVGKTSIAQQLVNARIGIGQPEVLGLPVAPAGKVLYLALDRPPQIARSWRRMVTGDDADVLAAKVAVWQGPLPFKLSFDNPTALTDWAAGDHGATCVVVDSYKNLVANLSSEESGALIDSVMQEALANGLDWLALHHPRKSNGENKTPNTLDDVYGSTWLTAGMGSVLGLWGKAGDEMVSLLHLKQPAELIGPMTVMHNHATGSTVVLDLTPSATGKPAIRERAILARFMQRGGAAAPAMTLDDFVDLGSDETMRSSLKMLVDRGLLSYSQGGGQGIKSTWKMLPLQSNPSDL